MSSTPKRRREYTDSSGDQQEERRKSMNEFVDALKANTSAIRELEGRFDIFCTKNDVQEKIITSLKESVLGNGKLGLDKRVMKLEIYAAIIVGLCSAGVVGVIGYIIVKIVELVYTHGIVPITP
jgi:hypothetical protein